MSTFKSMFSAGSIFIALLFAVVITFFFSGVSSTLTSLGFETTQSVKAELAKTKMQLDTATNVNESNIKQLEVERRVSLQMRSEIAKVTQRAVNTESLVTSVKTKKTQKDLPVIAQVIEKTTSTADTITLPIQEINTLSASNIEQVHEVYKALFPAT